MDLKQTLLNYNLVNDNIYLDKYVELLNLNKLSERADGTQAHHAIPVAYYKKLYNLPFSRSRIEATNYADADENNFKVNLLYKDHLLAHCYLTLCAKEPWFIFACSNTITFWTNGKTATDILAMEDLDAYQQAYEKLCEQKHARHIPDEQRQKIAEKHKRENMTEEYHNKLSEANLKRFQNPENRKKLSEALKANTEHIRASAERLTKMNQNNPPAKGLIWVYKDDGLTRRISPDKLEEYIANGWTKGRPIKPNWTDAMRENNRLKSKMFANSEKGKEAKKRAVAASVKKCSKRVYCIELDKYFDSAAEAARFFNLNRNAVSRAARLSITAAGYHWQYSEKEQS